MSAMVPALRFQEFSGQWRSSRLGRICSIKTGRLDANAAVSGGKFPFFTCARDVYEIDVPAFDSEALLVSGNGANVGYVHYYKGQFNAYQRTYVLESFSESIFFVEQFLRQNLRARIHSEVNEGNTPYIVRGTLADMTVTIPTLPEQQKIAAFLGAVDGRLAGLRRAEAGLVRFKAGLMQRLFSQKLRFTQDDGSAFPDWEEKRLGEIVTVFYGKDHKALKDGDIPVYGTGGIMRYVNTALSMGPSILIGRKGTINKPMLVDGPFWTVDTLFHTKISAAFDPRLVFAVVEQVNWLQLNEATGVPSLNATGISKVKVCVPPHPDEQRKIAAALSALDVKVAATRAQITKTERFKQGLLQQMFV